MPSTLQQWLGWRFRFLSFENVRVWEKNWSLTPILYIKAEWVLLVLSNPVKREVQPADDRIRHWVWIEELARYLRVVTLEDGITVHNAFPDRRFSP